MGTPKCYSRVSNNRTASIKLAKKDNLLLLNQFKTFSINLNAQHVNGITHRGKLVAIHSRLLDTFKVILEPLKLKESRIHFWAFWVVSFVTT